MKHLFRACSARPDVVAASVAEDDVATGCRRDGVYEAVVISDDAEGEAVT